MTAHIDTNSPSIHLQNAITTTTCLYKTRCSRLPFPPPFMLVIWADRGQAMIFMIFKSFCPIGDRFFNSLGSSLEQATAAAATSDYQLFVPLSICFIILSSVLLSWQPNRTLRTRFGAVAKTTEPQYSHLSFRLLVHPTSRLSMCLA